MRNLLIILLAFTVFSCQKQGVERLFDKLPEERMAERNSELRAKLLESPNGWKGFLRTSLRGGAYAFYMAFDATENVAMLSDWDNASAVTKTSSTYRIKYVMNTSLIFDTYNYISIMQQPDAAVNGGTAGQGLQSDIEFEYMRSTADSIILKGKRYGNYLYLIKANAQEKASYDAGAYSTSINDFKNFVNTKRNNYITVPNGSTGQKLAISFNLINKTITGQSVFPNDSIAKVDAGFAYSLDGGFITEQFSFMGVRFIGIKKKDANAWVMLDIAGKEYVIEQNAVPLIPFTTLIGYNKTYKGIIITGQTLPAGVSSDFNAVFSGMVSRFNATNRTIESVEFRFSNSTTAFVNIWYVSGTSRFLADASFDYTYQNGIVTLSNYKPAASNANWTTRINEIGSFATWFINGGPFRIDWVGSTNPSVGDLGGLYQTNNQNSIFYGKPNP